jgi:hypothetical protein
MLIVGATGSCALYMEHPRLNDLIVLYLVAARIHDYAHLDTLKPYMITWFATPWFALAVY